MSFIAINAIVASAMLVSLGGGTSAQIKPAADLGMPVTVAGCLKKWDPAMVVRGGNPNPAKLEYVLIDLGPGATAAPALPNVMRYLVRPKDTTVALSSHVNHRIEVAGIATGLGVPHPPGTAPVTPTLTVLTVKMVSTDCL